MTVKIRFATAEDQATCIDFIGTLNGGPIRDDWHVTFAALVTRERGAIYVAEDDELGLLGVATVSFNLAVRYGGEYCQLVELIVDPAGRGQNIGGRLVEKTVEQAKLRGCAEYGLYLIETTEQNLPFYEKYGFKKVAVRSQ